MNVNNTRRFIGQASLLAGLILVLICSSALALEIPARPEGRVTDQTRTLSQSEKVSLDRKLEKFERETTNQIAVLLIPSLEGENLEDYSIRLAEKWKIGQKGKNNGVILLIVKKDRKVRIEVGYGLEGALPDALAGAIIRNEIAPRFRAGQFYQGVEAGVEAIMAATKGEYKASPKRSERSPFLSFFSFLGMSLLAIVLPLLIIGFLVFFLWFAFRARTRHYHSGGSGGWTTGGGFLGGGSSWGDSGGGFSGGGGDFGGGGASGDW